jgi:hypothetical protein
LPLVYDELRKLAAAYFGRSRRNNGLDSLIYRLVVPGVAG